MMILKEWKIKYGDQEIPISAEDIVETLGRAVSIVFKEAATNPHIKGDTKMKIIYEMDTEILQLLKEQFSDAAEDMRRKILHHKIPGGQKK
jgi:hypothetical protein